MSAMAKVVKGGVVDGGLFVLFVRVWPWHDG